MKKGRIFSVLVTTSLILVILLVLFKYYINNKIITKDNKNITEPINSNIIVNVKYFARDSEGNEFTIQAQEGETDIKNTNIIFLKKVSATILINKKDLIKISSDFGKYNINNYDTIFSKNILINYLEKKISSDYLDFSIQRNSMIISKNVIYTDNNNVLKTDVIDINLKTKDFKFFMLDNDKKVQLINKE